MFGLRWSIFSQHQSDAEDASDSLTSDLTERESWGGGGGGETTA